MKNDFAIIGTGMDGSALMAQVVNVMQREEKTVFLVGEDPIQIPLKSFDLSMIPNPIKSSGLIRHHGPKRRYKATNVTPKKKKRKK